MTTSFNIASATTAELLAFFNANTGGTPVKKFADRKTAERRCQALADEMLAEEAATDENNGADFLEYMEAGIDRAPTNEENGEGPFMDVPDSTDLQIMAVEAAMATGDVCPSCGATLDITSGTVVERAGKQHIIDEDYFTCHGCGNEWGTKDADRKTAKVAHKVGPRPAMAASLKIDRHIVDLLTGIVYDNACRVWKAGLVSSAQGDRLSAELYGAFKNTGKRDYVCKVNGHSFRLAYL